MAQNQTDLLSDSFLAVPFWAGDSTSLGLSSHIYKMGIIIPPHSEVQMRRPWPSTQQVTNKRGSLPASCLNTHTLAFLLLGRSHLKVGTVSDAFVPPGAGTPQSLRRYLLNEDCTERNETARLGGAGVEHLRWTVTHPGY